MNFRLNTKKAGFTLVEIMIVVLIIGILLAIAIPNFVSARESSRAKACVGNLKQIDSATQQFCMDKKVSATNYSTAAPTLTTNDGTAGSLGLLGPNGYVRTTPACPSSGTYSVAATITAGPLCTTGTTGTGDYAGPNSSTSVATPGKYYHGL